MTIRVYVPKLEDALNTLSDPYKLEWEAIQERQLEQEVADWGAEKAEKSTGSVELAQSAKPPNALTLSIVPTSNNNNNSSSSNSGTGSTSDQKEFDEDYKMNADDIEDGDDDGHTMEEKYEQYTSICEKAGEKHTEEEVKTALQVLDTVFDTLDELVVDGVYPRSKALLDESAPDLWKLMREIFPAEVPDTCKW